MDVRTPDPAAQVDLLHARCRKLHTPCGGGRMVWRVWGRGAPVVLLHGGSGSWTHWIRTIPALEHRYTLYVADIPGLGDSDPLPEPYDSDRLVQSTGKLADVIVGGLKEILPPPARYDLVGFSFGAVTGGAVAAREDARLRSFTMIGASALGVKWPGLRGRLRAVEDGMTDAEVRDVQRHNLHLIMLAAPPAQIDELAAWLQMENTRRSRLGGSYLVAPSDTLLQALRGTTVPLAAIWGRQDTFLHPGFEDRVRALESVRPDVTTHLIDDAGHWVMYEAPEAFNATLIRILESHDRMGGQD